VGQPGDEDDAPTVIADPGLAARMVRDPSTGELVPLNGWPRAGRPPRRGLLLPWVPVVNTGVRPQRPATLTPGHPIGLAPKEARPMGSPSLRVQKRPNLKP